MTRSEHADCIDEYGLCICSCTRCAPKDIYGEVCICPDCAAERCGMHPDGDYVAKPCPVRVDPSDPATIERAAKEICWGETSGLNETPADTWVAATEWRKARSLSIARAVLASLTDTGDNKEQTE